MKNFKRVRSALKSKVIARNVLQAIISAVSTVRHGAGIIQCTKEEFQQNNRKTRNLVIIYGGLHPRPCVNRLYKPRKDGGRGLVSV